jgi:recombinational DNA repair protein (RecF pathway)
VFENKVLKETLGPYNMLRIVEFLNLREEGYAVLRNRCEDETGRTTNM